MTNNIPFKADRDAMRLAKGPPGPHASEADKAHWGRLVGQKLNAMEGNPLDAEQIAMFKRFESEELSHEERRDEIARRGRLRAQGLL